MTSLLDIPPEIFELIASYLEPRWERELCQTSLEVAQRLTNRHWTTTVHWNPFNPSDKPEQLQIRRETNKLGCLRSTVIVIASVEKKVKPGKHGITKANKQHENAIVSTLESDALACDLLLKTLKSLVGRRGFTGRVTIAFRVETPKQESNKTKKKDDWHTAWQAAALIFLQCVDVLSSKQIVMYGLDFFYDQPRCSLSSTALNLLENRLPLLDQRLHVNDQHLGLLAMKERPWHQLRSLCLSLSDSTDIISPQISHRVNMKAVNTVPNHTNFAGLIKLLEACYFLTTFKLHYFNLATEGATTPFECGQASLLHQIVRANCLRNLQVLELKNIRSDSGDVAYLAGRCRDLSLISVTLRQGSWKTLLGGIHRYSLERLRLENLATPQWIYFPVGSELNPWGKMTRTLFHKDWFECRKPVEFHVSSKKVGRETHAKQLYRAEHGPP